MKVFISADIEGVSGAASWEQLAQGGPEYEAVRRQMTAEVRAACEGALAAGATDILVRDAHGSARNISHSDLPRQARLVRCWSGGPLMMMDGLERGFAAAMYVGYHSRAGSGESPLAHTMSTTLSEFRVNGRPVSEFELNAWAAAALRVPSVFISGDRGACAQARRLLPGITAVETMRALGEATVHLHPAEAADRIRRACEAALKAGDRALPRLPARPLVELKFREIRRARRFSLYPGATRTGERAVRLRCRDCMDILRAVQFIY